MVGDSPQQFAAEVTQLAKRAAQLGFELDPIETTDLDEIDFGTVSGQLSRYVNSPIMADVELILDVYVFGGIIIIQKCFVGHKKTLAASSKYFEATFNVESEFMESSEFSVKIALLVALSCDEVCMILEFAYTDCNDAIEMEVKRAKESKRSCLLRLSIVAECLQMEHFLDLLTTDAMYNLGPFYFKSQDGWMKGIIFPPDILNTLLQACQEENAPLRTMLEWIELTLSSEGRPHNKKSITNLPSCILTWLGSK